MKVKYGEKDKKLFSPLMKEMDSGATCLSLLLAVDDPTTEHNGKSLFASIWLKPKKIVISQDDPAPVKAQKQKDYAEKLGNTLRMNLPSIYALTGDSSFNLDDPADQQRFMLAIGCVNNPKTHGMTQKVYVKVSFDSNGNKINFRADRISPIPSSDTVSKVDLLALADLNTLKAALGQGGATTAPADEKGAHDSKNETADGGTAAFLGGGASVPGAAGGMSFK